MACENNLNSMVRAAGANGIPKTASKSAFLAKEMNRDKRNDPRRRKSVGDGQAALERTSADTVRRPGEDREARGNAPGGRPSDPGGNASTDRPGGDGTGGSVGDGTRGVDFGSRGGAGGGQRQLEPRGALLAVLNEKGSIDWPAIAQLSGRSEDQVRKELLALGAVFPDPVSGTWQNRDEYLSGNVRAKIRAAQAAARHYRIFETNVEALKQVQPADLKPGEIYAPLGAGWIPPTDVGDFAAQRLGMDVRVDYIPKLAKWMVQPTGRFKESWQRRRAVNKMWGTKYADAVDLLDRSLNGRASTISIKGVVDQDETFAARDKQKKISEEFSQWLWSDSVRARRLAEIYNEKFNNTVPRQYDGSHIDLLPGQNPAITLKPHQKNSIWRGVQSNENHALIHTVGAGKTFVLCGVTMEARRLGLLGQEKAVHVVPNHRPQDHAIDFKRMFQKAELMVVTSKDLSPDRREDTMARMANFKGDAIIMSHSAMEAIPIRRSTEAAFMGRLVAEYDETINKLPVNATKKRRLLEKAREKYQAQLDELLQQEKNGKPEGLTWEDLGIGYLGVDEVTRYKNLITVTRHQGLAGINTTGSARAQNFYMKAMYCQQHCSRCGQYIGDELYCPTCNRKEERQGRICVASATPIDNSLGELFTWQRILQPRRLKEMGLEHFDAWAKQFGQVTTSFELSPFGNSYREATRFSRFANVPELSRIFGEVADVQLDTKKLGLPLPKLAGGKAQVVVSPISPQQQAYMQVCEERAERVLARMISPSEDNYLVISGDLHRSALDHRLIDPTAPDDPNSKVNKAVAAVLERYRAGTGVELPGVPGKHDLTQAIFLDTSVPRPGFNLYDDIKRKLISGGIPAEEIAFIHDASDDIQKSILFKDINQGKVRVLLASTPLAGEGSNLQRLLSCLHHLDAAGWTPKGVAQREGRIIRQGNLNPEVEILRYVVEGSSDAYRWQKLEQKATAANQVLGGDWPGRSTEDIGEVVLDYAEIKAIASGNPIVKQRVRLQSELQQYQALQRVYQKQQFEAQQALDLAQKELAVLSQNEPASERISELTEQIAEHQATLHEPFEHEQKLAEVYAELEKVETEIAKINTPISRRRSGKGGGGGLGGIVNRLLGRGGRA